MRPIIVELFGERYIIFYAFYTYGFVLALLHVRHAPATLVEHTCSHLTKSSASTMTEFSEAAVPSNKVRMELPLFKYRPSRGSALAEV